MSLTSLLIRAMGLLAANGGDHTVPPPSPMTWRGVTVLQCYSSTTITNDLEGLNDSNEGLTQSNEGMRWQHQINRKHL